MTDQPAPQWGPPTDPSQQPAQPPSKRKKWPWIVGGVVVLFIAIGAIAGGGDDKTTAAAATSTSAAPTTTAVTTTVAPTTTTVAPSPTPTTTVAPTTPPVLPTAPPVVAPPPPVSSAAKATPVRVPMPAVVCMNLQAAQDKIQVAGVFFSRSKDATGAGRLQVIDSNWIVTAQTPQPGALIGEGDAVLTVVKITEPNNC